MNAFLSWLEQRDAGPGDALVAPRARDLAARDYERHIVLVAELAGHRRLETTRRYSLPSKADRQKAVADLEIEF